MAEADVKAFVRFEKGNRLAVTETPQEVQSAIRALGTPHVPLVELTRTSGNKVLVNAHRITTISIPERGLGGLQ